MSVLGDFDEESLSGDYEARGGQLIRERDKTQQVPEFSGQFVSRSPVAIMETLKSARKYILKWFNIQSLESCDRYLRLTSYASEEFLGFLRAASVSSRDDEDWILLSNSDFIEAINCYLSCQC